MMLNHVDPTQVEVFRDGLAVKFALGAIGLIEPAPPTLASADAGTRSSCTGPPILQLMFKLPRLPEPEPTEPAPQPDIEKELNKWPLRSLRSLVKSKGVDGRGTKANLARRLKALVTVAELRAAS